MDSSAAPNYGWVGVHTVVKQVFQALAVLALVLTGAAALRSAPAAAEAFPANAPELTTHTIIPVWDAEAAAQWFAPPREEQVALNLIGAEPVNPASADVALAMEAEFEVDGCQLPTEVPPVIKPGTEVAVAMARGLASVPPTIVAKPSTPIIASVCADGCQLVSDTGGDEAGWFDALGPIEVLASPDGRRRVFIIDAFFMHRHSLAPDPHPPRIA